MDSDMILKYVSARTVGMTGMPVILAKANGSSNSKSRKLVFALRKMTLHTYFWEG